MIFTYIFTGVFMLLSLLIQGHPSFDVIRIAGVKPDLLFITIVYMAYNFGSFYGEIVGFIGGIMHDSVSNAPLGLLTLPKVVIGFAVGMFGRNVIKSNLLTVTLLIFAASLIKGFIMLILSYMFHEGSVGDIISIILPESFYNSLLAPGIFFVFDKVFEKELQREGYF